MNEAKKIKCLICSKHDIIDNLEIVYCSNCEAGQLMHKECFNDDIECPSCNHGFMKEKN